MKSLDQIALECGTDKSSKGHNYAPYYELFFDPLMYKPINLLEIGIDKGDSVRMWQEYFPHSEIHGIDIRGDYGYLQGIKTHVVDHSKKEELLSFGLQYDQYFDIIIEDGSHMSEDSINTFQTLFPYLKPGGWYAIEDLLCDYDGRWNKGISSIDRIKQMVGEVQMNGNIPNSNICANKIEAVKKYAGTYFEKSIEFIFVSCGLCIIKKI